MNNPSTDRKIPGKEKDRRSSRMRFGGQRLRPWAVYAILGTIALLLFGLFVALSTFYQAAPETASGIPEQSVKKPVMAAKKHGGTYTLINKLKQYGMWGMQPCREVPRFFIKSYPADLSTVDNIAVRKRVFLHSLLPHALYVREEALHRREKFKSLLNKIDCSLEDINFDADHDLASSCSWSDFLAEEEVNFIRNLTSKYRDSTAAGLLQRIDAVPTSIILAQGALESSWGSSRFAREGNSVFGMWTWKTPGMIPARRDEGKNHKVRSYDNVLDAVRSYHLTLNRLEPYEQFRQLRSLTDNPLIMAEGLTLYSERGEEYVEDIKNVILSNDLQQYDDCRLSGPDQRESSESVTRTTTLTEPGKTSF